MPAQDKPQQPWRRLLGRLGVDLRPGEGRRTALLFLSFFGIIAFHYVAKTMRQSTFVDSLGATRLPYVYLLVAVTAYPLLRIYLRFTERVSRERLLRGTCLVAAASMVLFWWLFTAGWVWVTVAFYLWVSLVFVATMSQFWSYASRVLDARQARRLFGVIGAGGLLGSVAGGQIARLIAHHTGAPETLLVAALVLAAVAVLLGRVREARGVTPPKATARTAAGEAPAQGTLRLLWASPHLRMIGLVLLLGVMVAQIVDLQFSWAVEQATTDLGQRTAWFGNFFSAMGVAAFLFQILFTSRIHTVLGVGVALRVLPVAVILGTLALLGAAGFLPEAVVVAALSLKLGENGLRYSLDQSTRELLFLPIPAAQISRAKAIIDVFVQRAGKGMAALLLLPVTFGWLDPIHAGALSLLLCVLWLFAAGAVTRTYVRSFRTGLRDRTVDAVASLNLADVKTVELLVQSLGSTDTRQVLHSLEILQANGRGHLVPPLLLYHDDAEVRRRTLTVLAGVDRKDTAPLVERRLGDDDPEVRAEAIRVLTQFNAADACALMRPRLTERDPRVRAAAVTCLVNHGTEEEAGQARASLREMLQDGDPEVRAEAVKAMGAVHGATFEAPLVGALDDPSPRVAREAIHAVQRVVAREGFRPIFLPRLISHLRNRRLKADAREALVAYGGPAVPVLAHFMKDREESIFVRRSLPKTLARIEDPAVVESLLDSLVEAEDAFLRAQLVEALSTRREDLPGSSDKIERAVHDEARRYLMRLADIAVLASPESLRFEGPVVRWDRREQNLLVQMISERLEDHLKILFGMLALILPPGDVWAAYRSLISGQSRERAHALEYLDNTLKGDLRKTVFAVIDDASLDEKLRRATRLFLVPAVTRTDAVGRLLDGGRQGDADARALAVAGLYTLYTDRMEALYPLVRQVRAECRDPLVQETAVWVQQRLDLPDTGNR